MFIKKTTIEKVEDVADIVEVIGEDGNLFKKTGLIEVLY
jgi:hypothetical protein